MEREFCDPADAYGYKAGVSTAVSGAVASDGVR